VADLFKQYKIRIWMSAVNPASVVNPSGQTQIQPPSAIGPGAIVHPRTPNAPASVGGFGNNAFQNEQYGECYFSSFCRFATNNEAASARGRRPQGNAFDEGNYAFSQQLPQYPLQQPGYQYPMQYGHQQMAPAMYGRPAYPAATSGQFMGGTTYYDPAQGMGNMSLQ
jgi:hypothetical protein